VLAVSFVYIQHSSHLGKGVFAHPSGQVGRLVWGIVFSSAGCVDSTFAKALSLIQAAKRCA